MPEKVDSRAVAGVLYGLYKALYGLVGDNAAAVMRRAAPDILDQLGKLGVDFSCVDDIDKLSQKLGETAVNAGLCDEMKFSLNGSELTADITNCTFFDLTKRLKEEGIPPFGCPFAALTIAIAEKNLGKRARLKTLEPVGEGNSRMVVDLMDK